MKAQATDPLPTSTDGITPEWLGAALGTPVDAVEIESVIWGTASKVFLTVTYPDRDPDGPPEALCIKGGFQDELRAVAGVGYQLEAAFYRDLAPHLGIRLPHCWFAGADAELNQGLVIVEDLRTSGARFGRPGTPYTADEVAAGLELLARMHAETWDRSGAVAGAPWLTVGSPLFRPVVNAWLTPEHWDDYMARPQTELLPDELRDRERVAAAVARQWELDEQSVLSLSHGDAHVSNTYVLPGAGPTFLDWQVTCLNPWADDVAFFMVGSMDVEARRTNEVALLTHYLDALTAFGGDAPGFDDARVAVARHHLHGLMFALCPPEMQPPDDCRLMGERFGAAAADHETLRHLGA